MRSIVAVGHGMLNQSYHNGTESRELLPLWMEVVTVGCPGGCCRRCAACGGLPHRQCFPRFAAVVDGGVGGRVPQRVLSSMCGMWRFATPAVFPAICCRCDEVRES